ncbi:MAG: alpha-amylase family glycosyl hydrolase, partial [Candidatus Acidiferrales bacterium]
MKRAIRFAFAIAFLTTIVATLAHAQDFKKQVIYQIVTDRFCNGDTSNDNPPQSSGLFDSSQTNWNLYWGGDLAGIQAKLSYLHGMGVTALWISPPMDNINVNIPDGSGNPTAPYHGYSAHDFMRIEEHFGDVNNTWTAFDNLVTAAHNLGMKIIVDFPVNDSNPNTDGEDGALYNDGTLVTNFNTDPNGCTGGTVGGCVYHHTPGIPSCFCDRFQIQYDTLEGLADFNQEDSTTDSYLKSAMQTYQAHGVDAFRIDAVKHATWGWEYSLANTAFTTDPSFFFGEWFLTSTTDEFYHDFYKYANKSGMSVLDYALYQAVRDVFASNNNFSEIDSLISTEDSNFTWQNDLVTFFDNHDNPRFLNVNDNTNRLNEATAYILTERGIPIIYYGDEQYLFNPTSGGSTPYNRQMMSSFSTSTTQYNLIKDLATLRQNNDAVAYGSHTQRWINNDVYIYERQFYNSVVLVAINKNDSTSYSITGLNTALPAGNYSDYLGGLMGGSSIVVGSGSGGNNPVTGFTLNAHTVAVWQVVGSIPAPEVGSIGPTLAQPGVKVTIAGQGFGASTGSVNFNGTNATINSWSSSSVTFTVPSVANGVYNVQLKNSSGTAANTIQFTVLTAQLIPVTFTVNNATPTNTGDYIFLAGNTVELGNWGSPTPTFDNSVGPLLDPNYPTWFLNVSVPAGQTIQFKFVKIAADGTVTWENGSNHSYLVPTSGIG